MQRYKLDVTVPVLGTDYRVIIQSDEDEPRLKECDGFTDKTSHLISVGDVPDTGNLDYPAEFIKKIIRHELIHAFMFESGLAENWKHDEFGQEELTVDWFAIQMPKIQTAVDIVMKELKEVTPDA